MLLEFVIEWMFELRRQDSKERVKGNRDVGGCCGRARKECGLLEPLNDFPGSWGHLGTAVCVGNIGLCNICW